MDLKLISSQTIHLLNATKEERQQFLDSFDLVLTDCDGTVWDLVGPLEGASTAVDALKEHGKRVIYVTNNSSRSGPEYDKRFKKFNFDASYATDVIHPGIAEIEYLRSIDFKGPIYLVGSNVLRELLTEAGFDVIPEDANTPIEDTLSALYDYGTAPEKASAVIYDCPINQSYKQIVRAQLLLEDPECKFIVGGTDCMLPMPRPFVGAGFFIEILEKATQRKPIVLGKPGKDLREIIIAKYNITDPKRVLFVGDTPEQDIGFGKFCGFQTLAVLFNRTEENLLTNADPNQIADFYVPRFADLTQVFADLDNNKK